jgi:ribosome maturation factor RimP
MEARHITDLVNGHLGDGDLFLVNVKLTPGKLTVFVDGAGGVTVAQCTELNRYLRDALDAEGFTETHEIEVSSPGPNQPLRDYRQYAGRIGKGLRVVLKDGTERHGTLAEADRQGFALVEAPAGKGKTRTKTETTRRFAFDEVREARVEFNVS